MHTQQFAEYFRQKFKSKSKHILRQITFSPQNRDFYEIMWTYMVERGRP
jgi:hypothetical protein